MENKQTKYDRRPLTRQIEEGLMNYIQNEELAVGMKIPNEFELAERFKVGRSTVREAIRSLAAQGILEVRRGSGTYVKSREPIQDDPLGLNQIEDEYAKAMDILEVRLMLEPEIAANAAKNATEEDKQKLKQLCDETEALYVLNEDHTHKDSEFHSQIAKCSKNQVVENLIPIITAGIQKFIVLTGRKLQNETIETHRAITNAILNGDPNGARYAMIMHLNYNRLALQERMQNNSANNQTSNH